MMIMNSKTLTHDQFAEKVQSLGRTLLAKLKMNSNRKILARKELIISYKAVLKIHSFRMKEKSTCFKRELLRKMKCFSVSKCILNN